MNTVGEAASSAPSPTETSAPQTRQPRQMPIAANAAGRDPIEALRSTIAVSTPGVIVSTVAAATKATRA